MSELTSPESTKSPGRVASAARSVARVPRAIAEAEPARQAHWILRTGFVAAPVLAGADKFFNAMCEWEKYLAPQVVAMLPVRPRTFMYGVGVVEIAAGALVARKPSVGAYVVAGWLGGIIGNFLLARRHYDIALRDLGLMLGAVALGRLSSS
jgi:hypothetical protein